MITRKTRRGIIALLVLTALSFWLGRSQDETGVEAVTGLDPKLNYVLRNFELQFFDEHIVTVIKKLIKTLHDAIN